MNFVKARNFVHLVMTGNGARCKCSDMHLTKCNLEAAESLCHSNWPCGGGAPGCRALTSSLDNEGREVKALSTPSSHFA